MEQPNNLSKLLGDERVLLEFSGTYINKESQSVLGRCYLSQHNFAFCSVLFKTEFAFTFKEMLSLEEQSHPEFANSGLVFTLKDSNKIYIAGIEDVNEVKTYISLLKKHKKLSTMKSDELNKTLERARRKSTSLSIYSDKEKRSVKSAQSAQTAHGFTTKPLDTKSQAESIPKHQLHNEVECLDRNSNTSSPVRTVTNLASEVPLKASNTSEDKELLFIYFTLKFLSFFLSLFIYSFYYLVTYFNSLYVSSF